METNIILNGNSIEELKKLPSESINCCVTSPPYWSLRDYQIEGQLGLEKTFKEYIDKLCNIFDEVKRVLRKDGTCFVNLGDTYYSVSGGKFLNDNLGSKDRNELKGLASGNELKNGNELKQKNLCNIPARFSIEMQNPNFILREDLTDEEKEFVIKELIKRKII
jgi:DNA modification methylase